MKYFGNQYEPTTNPKMYFRESDIDQPYEVMGRIYISFAQSENSEKTQKKIIDKVKKVGGDAVMMGNLQEIVTGSKTTSVGGGSRTGKKNKGYVGGSSSKTKDDVEEKIEVQVLKYK